MNASAPRRSRLRRACAVSLALVVTFALLEVGFRLRDRFDRPDGEVWAVYDAELGYVNNPRSPEHNALGLRDHEVGPKTRPRLLMLGDSLAWYGDDVDDTWVGRLDTELEELDVLNLAVKGWTLHQELLWLRRDGEALEPDAIGIGFVLNDLLDVLHRFEVEDGEIVGRDALFTDEAAAEVDSPLYALLRRSRFLVWLRRRFAGVGADVVGGAWSFESRPDFRTAWRDERWPAIEEKLAGFVADCAARERRTFLVAFPFGEQYRADYLERDRAYVLSPQRRLAEICARVGLPLLDLYPVLERERDLEADGIHLTRAGRERVAAHVADWLRERGWDR